ncbi:LPS-assembly protein LptD [Undibacterium sp. RTI2.2]|nr:MULTISPECIES: LPS-assembly protein LptD [unclassified Undibacterium]MDY7536663.1 LPS-assembly protein LptD [Undibacterium sp. 5I1]MEB0118461.1 LPS-assembly protein LptD [Undibacterium sp. RTI2.2]
MRRKTVLSHPQPLFPTILAIAISALFPVPVFAQVAPFNPVNSAISAKPVEVVIKGDKDQPTVIQAEQMSGRPERYANFDNDVEVTKADTKVNANKATYTNLEDEIKAFGDIRMSRSGNNYLGDSMRLQMDSGVGFILNPIYKLVRNNAQGRAERVDFESDEQSTIVNGTYTTCDSNDPDWYLESKSLYLDTELDRGVAGKTIVYFKGVPILATPFLTFPLSGARHSGFLPPIFGGSSRGGPELALPYYVNIAPNRDLTLYPKLIERRGFQLGLEARYMGDTYSGNTTVEGLIDDKQTNTNRYAISSIHQQSLLPQLVLGWNLNAASDDNYPSDFSSSITKTAQRLLLRDVNTTYFGWLGSATLRASNYQVLQDPTAPIARPYDRLPQLELHAERHDVLGFDWSVDTILTRFWHPTLVRGDRAVFNPQISYPIVQPGYFVIPKLSLNATNYHLVNPDVGQDSDFHRIVPTFSLDSGLVFERPSTLFGKAVTQTLEPRVFYVNTPYRDQSLFPNFDSGIADFNFAQIFSENRFTGLDRIGDSNQITAALISRYIESDGEERLKLAIGQRFYFNTQKVTLDNTTVPQSRSDLLLSASGKFSDQLSADSALQVSQSDRHAVRSNYGVRWQPAPQTVFNAEYRYQLDTLKQVDLSTQLPINKRWFVVARSNYSLPDKKLVDGLAGFEYKDPCNCWSFRMVAQRFSTTSEISNTSFFIQLELNGLSKIGSNPLDALKKNISGYQPIK